MHARSEVTCAPANDPSSVEGFFFLKKKEGSFYCGKCFRGLEQLESREEAFQKKKGGDEECHGDVQSIVGS